MGKREISHPWQVVAADIMGPLPKSKHGFEYVLVFEDVFSKWVEVIGLRRANAKSILKELKERVILRFGTPEVFLSDAEYLKALGIHHSVTPPYYPQANPVERANRTLKTRLIAYVEDIHASWDENLPELMFSLNNAAHSRDRTLLRNVKLQAITSAYWNG